MTGRRLISAVMLALALGVLWWARGAERGPIEDVAVAADGATDEDATRARLVAPESRADGDPAGAQASRTSARISAEIDAESSVTIEIVAVEHCTGLPVAGAIVWAFDDDYLETKCDAAGRATFRCTPDLVLVGVKPPMGSSYIAYQDDPDTGAPSAQDDATFAAGETGRFELVLHRGATVFGSVTDAEGAPRAGVTVVHVPWDGDRRGEPVQLTTSADGRFEARALEPGEHVFGPDPPSWESAFDAATLDLERGDRRELVLRSLAPGSREITVRVVQRTSGEPWPFPVRLELRRTERLPGAQRPSLLRIGQGVTPFTSSLDAAPGTYDLLAATITRMPEGRVYVSGGWSDLTTVTIPTERAPLEIVLEAPDVPRLAHVDGLVVGDLGQRYLMASYRGEDWTGGAPILPLGPDGRFELWIDLDHLASGEVTFQAVGGGPKTTLGSITALEGTQQVTLTAPGD